MATVERVSVVGAGGWGTALAVLLAEKGFAVRLWGRDPSRIDRMRTTRENSEYLPGIPLPENLEPVAELGAAAAAEVILLVTPSKAFRDVASSLAGTRVAPGVPLVSCTKGIERGTGKRMSEILGELFPENAVVALSGPSLAEEAARRIPTAVVIGCAEDSIAQEVQRMFNGPFFRAYTSEDVAGIELGGALKNIFAIAAGVGDGLGLGDNSKAALVTRALAEMTRLGIALGGRKETFQGLSGVGDLMVTCFSRYSRNRGVGERLGRGESLEEITRSMSMVAEGIPTTRSALECARAAGIRVPIIEQIHALLYEQKPPREALMELMSRDPRPEAD